MAFVSDKTGKKEIYVMDYDGHNPVKLPRQFFARDKPHRLEPRRKADRVHRRNEERQERAQSQSLRI